MKGYVERKVRRSDRKEVLRMMRKETPILHPITLGVNYYDIDRLRAFSRRGEINFGAILDTNIVSGLLSLLWQAEHGTRQLSNDTRIVCGIMMYLVYTGIEINPELALYEKKTDGGPPVKASYDVELRILDHIHPQVYADLYSGKLRGLTKQLVSDARANVESDTLIQENISTFNYLDEEQPGVEVAYTNLIYAWCLYKTIPSQNERLNQYLKWSFSNSLSSRTLTLFVAVLLSSKRLPKMVKSIDTNDPEILLKNIRNVSWDLYHLGSVDNYVELSEGSRCWCLITRDRLIQNFGARMMQVVSAADGSEFVSKYYDKIGVDLLTEHMTRVIDRKDLTEHIEYVDNTLDTTIQSLEAQVYELLKVPRKT